MSKEVSVPFRNLKSDPREQVESFDRVRTAHQTETAEDYVEMINDLIVVHGEARVKDLAERFGVSNATVNKVVQRLNRDGYVTNEPYRALYLTPKGLELAEFCRKRHEIVLDYLLSIGVPKRIAEIDAEGVEHHVSPETLQIFAKALLSQAKNTLPKRKAK
jgi:DtxR family transcriptional regulator, manganese transport regulator